MGTDLIDSLLIAAIGRKADALYLAVGEPPKLRFGNRLKPLMTELLEPAAAAALMRDIAPVRRWDEFQQTGSAEFEFGFGEVARVRASMFWQWGRPAAVLRLTPRKHRRVIGT